MILVMAVSIIMEMMPEMTFSISMEIASEGINSVTFSMERNTHRHVFHLVFMEVVSEMKFSIFVDIAFEVIYSVACPLDGDSNKAVSSQH